MTHSIFFTKEVYTCSLTDIFIGAAMIGEMLSAIVKKLDIEVFRWNN